MSSSSSSAPPPPIPKFSKTLDQVKQEKDEAKRAYRTETSERRRPLLKDRYAKLCVTEAVYSAYRNACNDAASLPKALKKSTWKRTSDAIQEEIRLKQKERDDFRSRKEQTTTDDPTREGLEVSAQFLQNQIVALVGLREKLTVEHKNFGLTQKELADFEGQLATHRDVLAKRVAHHLQAPPETPFDSHSLYSNLIGTDDQGQSSGSTFAASQHSALQSLAKLRVASPFRPLSRRSLF